MPLDITVYGIQMPTLLPIFVLVAILQVTIDSFIAQTGLYRHVWHPGLFKMALFVCFFTLPCLYIYH